jgi:acetoin reductase-like protein
MASKGVAIVTGAANGIGRAIALRLSQDGFDLALNDVEANKSLLEQLSKEINDSGKKSAIVVADVTDETEVKNMIASTVEKLGGVDVMVANAGIAIFKPFLQLLVEDWDKLFAVNARGVFLCYKYAAEQMVKQGRGGRIIGASSTAGKRGEFMAAGYSATKHAVRGLTHVAARELAPHKITVNAYAPGATDTPMLRDVAGPHWAQLEEQNKQLTAVGYMAKPEDIAPVISLLASKEGHFITGTTICVDGGRVFD